MPGMMQRKGKLPGRTLRVSFKSAFFSVKPPLPLPPTPSLDLPQYFALTLQKGEKWWEDGGFKTSVSLRGGARHRLQLCANYSLIHKYSYMGIKEDPVSYGPLTTCCVCPFHILGEVDQKWVTTSLTRSSTSLEIKLTLKCQAFIYSSGTLNWAEIMDFKLVPSLYFFTLHFFTQHMTIIETKAFLL